MNKFFALLIFVGLLVFLYLSCPDKQAHEEAVLESLPEMATDFGFSDSDIDFDSPEVKKVIANVASPVAKAMGISIVDVDSYLFFSIGKVNDQVVTFGIGGYVFSYKDEIVKKAVEITQNAQ